MSELVFRRKNDRDELLDFADNLLVCLIRSLQDNLKLGLNGYGKLRRLIFREAKAILRDKIGLQSHELDDLTHVSILPVREEEAALGSFLAGKEFGLERPTAIFIVTHFPRHLRPCHVYQVDGEPRQPFDIITKGQQIDTGCRLPHDHEELPTALVSRSSPIVPESPEWRPYMIAYEIGMPPWGGLGLGINRLVQGLPGLSDIRETILFPRNAARLIP
ncbi:Aminoacyl-tRNA synthetase, class II (D/K/N) [Akanthomyces lecanii RCEF 1005]|uniref:Aminoacyl-tRNA synthetase, class II (D/K/N) n=1 Tax=Akanthomyces lecanii RCEF 1005 TaxID=1081108 RepID=A0A167ZP91_CORDF|nr:Aminoacyl-tRNA synthetase, class II (D/K/N) [Akanthomyces lecanii RCEF 1005]